MLSTGRPKRKKTCPECRQRYLPTRAFQPTCEQIDCQHAYGQRAAEKQRAKAKAKADRDRRQAEKAERERIKRRRAELMTIPQLKARLGEVFRRWVRLRDAGKSCISCDVILLRKGRVGGDYDAGHYRSVGSAKHLEFDERNVHGQCKYCNDHLKGNPAGYRPRLIVRIGLAAVEALESDQAARHYTRDQLMALYDHYAALVKELERG